MTLHITPTQKTAKLATANRRTFTNLPSHHHMTAAPLKHSTETLPIPANISGPLKKITLTTLFHGASFHQDHPSTALAKDATSDSKKNYLSSFNKRNELVGNLVLTTELKT